MSQNILTLISLPIVDPYENFRIETEIKNLVTPSRKIIRFWHNLPCMVLGRFQKEEYEVNLEFLQKNRIPLIRRQTGGGTVYHDQGTLNISFLFYQKQVEVRANKRCSELVQHGLKRLGIECQMNERYALFLQNRKVMGCASQISRHIFHYHASLLFDTNLDHLYKSIIWDPQYPTNDATFVRSVRSQVANLKDLFPTVTLEMIKTAIADATVECWKTNIIEKIDSADSRNRFHLSS